MKQKLRTFLALNKAILKDIVAWDKNFIVLSINKIIFSVIYPLLLSLIPKIIIDSIENEVGIDKLVLRILILSILMASISWINPLMHEKVSSKSEKLRINYQMKLMTKMLSCKFETLSNRNEYERAKYFVDGSGSAPSFDYIYSLSDWAAAIIGLLSCMLILSRNSIVLLIVFVFSVFIEYFFKHKQYVNKHEMKHNMYSPNIKSDYIFRKAMTTNFIRDAVIFGSTETIRKKCSDYNSKIASELKKYNKIDSKLDLVRILFIFARDLMICYAVIKNILAGNQNISDFVLYFGLIGVMTKWVSTYYDAQNNLSYICSVYDDYSSFCNSILESDDSLITNDSSEKIDEIEFQNISYNYGNISALKNTNLIIKGNQKIAIVGKNGSGKSTLANIICGLFKPKTGLIYVNGRKITYEEYSSLMSQSMSVMFQKDELLPETIYSNISYKDEYNAEKLLSSLNKTHINEKIEKLSNGINTRLIPSVNFDAPEFSGGEAQRLLMSRCFYKGTEINLFDEPTASLDVKAEHFVYESIKKENVLSLIISHRIANIMNSDIIIVMNNGKIEEIGKHGDLIKNKGIYYEMYSTQEKVFKN